MCAVRTPDWQKTPEWDRVQRMLAPPRHDGETQAPATAGAAVVPPATWTGAEARTVPLAVGDQVKRWVAALDDGDEGFWMIGVVTRVYASTPNVGGAIPLFAVRWDETHDEREGYLRNGLEKIIDQPSTVLVQGPRE